MFLITRGLGSAPQLITQGLGAFSDAPPEPAEAPARQSGAGSKKRRRRILMPDGRILIPSDDLEYQWWVSQIVSNVTEEKEEPRKPVKRRYKGAVKAVEVPRLTKASPLPEGFYETLAARRKGYLDYEYILNTWQAFLKAQEDDEDDAITILMMAI